MSRTQAMSRIKASVAALTDEQLEALAEMVARMASLASDEDDYTRSAIAEGLAEADRGEFASEAEVAVTFARLRST